MNLTAMLSQHNRTFSQAIRTALYSLILAATINLSAHALQDPDQPSLNWPSIKENLFPNNPDIIEDDFINLTTPMRAQDAALVPISVKFKVKQTNSKRINKIYLVIDNNPSPIVGTFTMTELNDIADISTRIRVNTQSHVRAIAQTADGQLHMTTNFVKASGGCSAPSGSDDSEIRQHMGKMKLQQKTINDNKSLHLLIKHPNYSGLQMDQVSRLWIPADYINHISVSLNQRNLLTFTGGISISENPSFTFHVKPNLHGQLKVHVSDSHGRNFKKDWKI